MQPVSFSPYLDEALDLVVADAPAEAEAAAEVRAARPVPQDTERVATRKSWSPFYVRIQRLITF